MSSKFNVDIAGRFSGFISAMARATACRFPGGPGLMNLIQPIEPFTNVRH
jgi:hypothetical protein